MTNSGNVIGLSPFPFELQMPDREMTLNVFGPSQAAVAERRSVDELLVERVCAGDEEAFGEMYRKYAPLVHGVLLARMPREEVADVVQEVFLAAYKNIRSLREGNALGGWLVRIARNHAVEYFRKRKPSEELTEDLRGRQNYKSEAAEVLRAIRSLPGAYSETLTLRLIEGMSGQEIADVTGLKPESVRVNLHRGMDMLRQKLGIKAR
jgi:RNA polymerase sigma-70 factor (ECF subfamily)